MKRQRFAGAFSRPTKLGVIGSLERGKSFEMSRLALVLDTGKRHAPALAKNSLETTDTSLLERKARPPLAFEAFPYPHFTS